MEKSLVANANEESKVKVPLNKMAKSSLNLTKA